MSCTIENQWQKAYFGIMRARKYGSVWESKGNSRNKYFLADIHVYCIHKLNKKNALRRAVYRPTDARRSGGEIVQK